MMHAPIRQLLDGKELDDLILGYAREDFGMFRRQIRPKMIWGWWTQEVAWQLQRFYEDMMAGKRPKLAIASPPQHGGPELEIEIPNCTRSTSDLRHFCSSWSSDVSPSRPSIELEVNRSREDLNRSMSLPIFGECFGTPCSTSRLISASTSDSTGVGISAAGPGDVGLSISFSSIGFVLISNRISL